MTANDKLRNTVISHSIYMERYKENEVYEIMSLLNKVDSDLNKKILSRAGKTGVLTTSRLEKMKEDVNEIIGEASMVYWTKMNNIAKNVAKKETDWAQFMIKDAIPNEIPISFIQPSPTQILAAIQAKTFDNMTVQSLIKTWEYNKKTLLTNALQQGFIQGETITEISKRLFGTKAMNYADGLVDISRRHIKTITRTCINHFASTARDITYRENSDLIKGIQWVSTLDGRTSPICINLDGKVDFFDGSKKELDGLRPPAHPNCRSTTAPILKSLKELGLSKTEFDPSTRASMNGQVSEKETYATWFQKQTEAFKKDVLGNSRYQLYLDKKLTIDKFIDNGKFMTLDEVEAKLKQQSVKVAIKDIPIGTDGMQDFGNRLTLSSKTVGGSTGARVYIDDEGQEWIVKDYSGNAEQVKNEFIANRLYASVGVNVPDSRIAYINNSTCIASKRLSSNYSVAGSSNLSVISKTQQVKHGFVTDAWLANWDVAGMSIDNIMWEQGKLSSIHRIDQGGCLLYRAQGSEKGHLFGKIVKELDTLRDSTINPASAKLFAEVSNNDIAKQIHDLKIKLKKIDINDIMDLAGLSTSQRTKYTSILEDRLDYLYDWEKKYKLSNKPVKSSKNIAGVGAKNRAEAEKLLQDSWNKLNGAEQRALKDFTGIYYGDMNRDALQGIYNFDLDSGIDKLPRYDGVVGRGISGVANVEEKFEKWKSGEWAHVELKAYSSSTVTKGKEFPYDGGYLSIIRARGKQNGGFIGSLSSHPSEHEYLYNHDVKFKVVGYAEKQNMYGDKVRMIILDEVDNVPDVQSPIKEYDFDTVYDLWGQNKFIY